MSQINWILCDIDGTLLSYEDKNDPLAVCKDTINEIHRFIDRGNEFSLVSGREHYSMLEVLNKLGIKNKSKYIIAFNGAVIYDVEKKAIINKNLINQNIIEQVFQAQEYLNQINVKNGLAFEALDGKVYLFDGNDSNFIGQELYNWLDLNPYSYPLKEQAIPKDKEIVRAFFYFGKFNKEIRNLHQQLKARIAPAAVCLASDDLIDISFLDCSKGNGAKFVAQLNANLSLENAIAIGDELNDLSMLEMAKIGITLKTARKEVKAVSNVIIDQPPSIVVAEAIRKYT